MTDSDSRPNIVFVMSDDHAAHAISAYGSILAQTPNLDRLADEGVRMDNVFCTNSICTPSRAAILTGQYSHRNGVRTLDDALDGDRETMPKLLQQSGYQTAMIGKWHLGHGPEHDPRGFDYWEVLPGQGRYHDPEFITPDGLAVREGYVTDLITDLSLDWLESTDPDRPFALFCHHKAVHSPWEPSPRHADLFSGPLPEPSTLWDDYKGRPAAEYATRMRVESMPPIYVKQAPPADLEGEELFTWWTSRVNPPQLEDRAWKYDAFIRDYLRCAVAIDESVGRILDALEERGLAENTIVIYTSDQGFFLGDHGWFDKRFMYDESLRMPFLMRWPKKIVAGSIRDDMLSNVDFAPTLLAAAGVEAPTSMQGRSFLPVLEGHTPDDWPDGIYYRYWMSPNEHDVPPHYGIRTRQHKLIRYDASVVGDPASEWELFDMGTDPREMVNLYGDPSYADIRDTLVQQLDQMRADYGDVEGYPQPPSEGSQVVVDYSRHPEYQAYREGALRELERIRAAGNGSGPAVHP